MSSLPEDERLFLPADSPTDHAIVPVGGVVLLGYGKYCTEVEKQIDWFASLTDDQKWASYQDYTSSAQRNAMDLQAAIDGMRRGREEYVAYLAEWQTAVGLEKAPQRKPERVDEPVFIPLRVWAHAVLFVAIFLVIMVWLFMATSFDIWTFLGGIALTIVANLINIRHVHPSWPRRIEFAAFLTFGLLTPVVAWVVGRELWLPLGLFGLALGVGFFILCAFFAVSAAAARR